jgi:hypothetical protein
MSPVIAVVRMAKYVLRAAAAALNRTRRVMSVMQEVFLFEGIDKDNKSAAVN